MKVTGTIYFLGAYRPAYFEADTIEQCVAKLLNAIASAQDRKWFDSRIREGRKEIYKDNCTSWSADHGDRGVSFAKRPHDPFLDNVTRDMPLYPGLDYSQAVNS